MRIYYNSATPPAETWVRVSAIVGFPEITTRRNMYGLCIVSIRDFQGALFSTWEPRDLIEMKVTDDAVNTLFRGYLMRKTSHTKDLILEMAGFGIRFYRRSFGSEEIKNYILEDGFPKTLNASNQIDLHYKDLAGDFQNFDWVDEHWIKEGKDVGLLIKDMSAGYSSLYWTCDNPIVQNGGAVQNGDFASTTTYDDGDIYEVQDTTTSPNPPDLEIFATMSGVQIPDTKIIKQIEIEYRFRTKIGNSWLHRTYTTVKGQIQDAGAAYYTFISDSHDQTTGVITYPWVEALSSDIEESSSPYIMTGDGLEGYLDKDGAFYDHLHLKFDLSGMIEPQCYAEIHIDYLRVKIVYHTYDISTIMRKITDSGNTGAVRWVKCADVANWQQMGITVDVDAFQIGQNTRKILQDIGSEAGLTMYLTKGYKEDVLVRPTATPVNEGDWTSASHVSIDDADVSPDVPEYMDSIVLSDATDGLDGEFTFNTFGDIVASSITEVKVWLYCRWLGAASDFDVDISFNDGGAWEGAQALNMTGVYGWFSVTFGGLTESSIDDLRVRLTADIPAGKFIEINILYVEISDYEFDTHFKKYMARKFKGQHCIEPLEAVRKLEGADWIEDYVNNRINIIKLADYVDSGVSLAQTAYEHEWEFEDTCNQVKYIYVWGKTSFNEETKTTVNIFAKAVDTDVTGELSKQIVDDKIMTEAEAQEIANTQLALLKDKRPSIRIPFDGVNIALQLGTTANLTMVRPAVGPTDYPIRMIQRTKRGKTGILTIIYCGMGETKWDEKILNDIQRNYLMARKGLTTLLTSNPYETGVGGITWADVGGGDEGAVAAVLADDQYIKLAGDILTAGEYALAQNAIMSFDAEQNDTTYSGWVIAIDTTGCNTYDLVYVDGIDSVAPADASDDTKMPAIGIVVAAGKVLVLGTVKDDDLIKCTTGKAVVYASTTLREVTETAPNGDGEIIQVVGICVGDHTLFVNVSLDMVEFVV